MHYQDPDSNIIFFFGPDDPPKEPDASHKEWQHLLDQAILPALAICHDRLVKTGRAARFARSSPVPKGAPYAAVLWTPTAMAGVSSIGLQFVRIPAGDVGFMVTITRDENGVRHQASLYARRFDAPSHGALELMLHVASEGLGYGIACDTRHEEPGWTPQRPRCPG